MTSGAVRRPRARNTRLASVVALLGAALLPAAVNGEASNPPPPPAAASGTVAFSAAKAFRIARLQVGYGPRPAGSAAQRQVGARLVGLLPHGHFEPVPGGLRNIVGELPGRGPAIVVGAHYDTTPVPGYLGANNSAAGVGAVIELARDLRGAPATATSPPVVFALFDGEEAPAGFTDFYSQGVRGSKAYVAAHGPSTRELILLDFIALHGELLPREAGSDPALWARLRDAANRVGVGSTFPPSSRGQILDDHTPFTRAGIPAVDLIDFDYPCWQKVCDNLSQVSRRSLGRVGKAVLDLVISERRRPG